MEFAATYTAGKVSAPHYMWTGSPAPKQSKYDFGTKGGSMYSFLPMQWIGIACSYHE